MSVKIRAMKKDEDTQAFQEYINEIIAEDAFIHLDHPVSLEDEKAWLEMIYKQIQKSNAGLFVGEENGTLVGISHWERGEQREAGNVIVGVTIRKSHRGHGIGRELFQTCINDAKKNSAENIWLKVVTANKTAIHLYEKMGFKKVGTLPKWYAYQKGLEDVDIMVLEKTC